MANNKTGKDASGATFTYATDDVSGVDYPIVKLAVGDEDSSSRVSASNPLPIDDAGGSLTVDVGAGEAHMGEVGGNSRVITPVVTISTSSYTAGDCLGGELVLTNAVRITSGSGVLHSVAVFDADNEKAAFDILLFDANPSGTYTDNVAPSWNSADYARFLGRVTIATTDYLTVNSRAVAVKTGIGLVVKANGSQNLYAVPVVSGTPLYSSTSDLTLRFGFLCD